MVHEVLLALLMMQAPTPTPIGFQGYDLGSPIGAVHNIDMPPGPHGMRRIECSDSSLAGLLPQPTAREARAGVIRCQLRDLISGTWLPASVPISTDYQVEFDLYYFNGSLFRIEVVGDITAHTTILRALMERYGRPTRIDEGEVRNGYGAAFPQLTTLWSLSGRTVSMITPFLNRDRMAVIYFDAAISREVEAAADAADHVNM